MLLLMGIQKLIDDVKHFAKQVCRVFMSPGDELVVFDPLKERLWSSYIFYADRIPELYDYIEDLVFSGAGPVPEFLKANQISFPSRSEVNSGNFIKKLASAQVASLIATLEDYLLDMTDNTKPYQGNALEINDL